MTNRAWLGTIAFVVVILAAACGSEDTGGALDNDGGASTTREPVATALVIEVTADDAAVRSGSVSCPAAGSTGTGHLITPEAAAAACEALADAAVSSRLIDGPPSDRACTEQYGGPEKATISGKLDGEDVDATVTRSDGCGISDWELLEPLVGPPVS